MLRSLHKGTFIIVEGDTDKRVFDRFADTLHCQIIPAYGKDNTVTVLEILEKDTFKGILAITDADFQHLENEKPASVNLFLTDTHDLECLILSCSNVLDKILSEFGSSNKIKQLPVPVINAILENALPLGLLRWLATKDRENLPLRFRDLDFNIFVNKNNLKTNLDKLLQEIYDKSKDIKIEQPELKKRVQRLKKENPDPWQANSGHDVVKLLTIGLQSVFGNKTAKDLTVEILEKMIRMNYEYRHFKTTQLFQSVKNWETANASYHVFPMD